MAKGSSKDKSAKSNKPKIENKNKPVPSKKVDEVAKPKIVVETEKVVVPVVKKEKAPVPSFKKAKSLDFAPEVVDSNLEVFKQRLSIFNANVLGNVFSMRHLLTDFAKREFGDIVQVVDGASPVEVAFVIGGIRVPEEGYYFIRP